MSPSRPIPTESAAVPLPADSAFHRLLEQAPDLIFRLRLQPEPRIDYINPASTRLVGYTPDEFYRDPDLAMRVVHPDDRPMLLTVLRQLRAGDAPERPIVMRWVHRTAAVIWTEQHLAAVHDGAGRVIAVEGIARDITSRRTAEDERQRLLMALGERVKELTALQRLARALEDDRRPLGEVLRDVVALLPEAYQHPAAAAARVTFGQDEAATPGFVPTEWTQRVTFQTRSGRQGTVEVAYRDGRLWHSGELSPFLAEEQAMLETIGDMLRANFERRDVDAELRASRARLRHLLTASPAVIYTTEPEPPYRATFVSANVEALLGHPAEAFQADPTFWEARVHPDDRPRAMEGLTALRTEGRTTLEYRFRRADGSLRWTRDEVCVTRDAEDRPLEHVGYWIDITEQKEAETALQRSERHFRRLIEHASDMVATLALDGTITYESPSQHRVLGYAPGELLGQNAFDLLHPDDRDRVIAAVGDGLRDRDGRTSEYRYRHKDGTWRWLESHGAALTDDRGMAVGLIVNSRDISERKAAEQALEAEHAFRKAVEDSVLAGLVATDQDGRITYVNRAFCEMTGYHDHELVGQLPPYPYWPPDERAARADFMARLLADDPAREEYEGRILRRSGDRFDALVLASPLRIGGARGALAAVYDITERKRLETQFRQAQKMEAIGRLAGGVAHDFNNLLTAILGYAELAADAVAENDPLYADLAEIRKAGESAASLTRQLLAFSRHQVLQPVALDLNVVLSEMMKILRRVIGEDVKLVAGLGTDLPLVRADRGQIEQVIMNLAVNARDAMPAGGTLAVQTGHLLLGSRQVATIPDLQPGRYAVLAVSDTGHGMDDGVLAHLFEPFFTTKERGKGTGLGLATVYGIVRQSGGHVEVRSLAGEGASLIVYLPAISGLAAEVPAVVVTQPGHGERILVVEDHDAIRALAEQVLRQDGYAVRSARTAEEALGIVETDPAPLDLLVTDVVMPGLDGPALADRLRSRFPGLRCLFMSGYTDEALQRHGVEGEIAFLQKPFRPAVLLRKVREQFDR
jgi:two-component system, cell cycle sensor histidine kinase and response regulator CckA